MSLLQRSLKRRIGRKVAFQAMFSAFRWLADVANSSHRVEWLGDYPLLATNSPRTAFVMLRFLCCGPSEAGGEPLTADLAVHAAFADHHELAKRFLGREHYVAFTYQEPSRWRADSADKTLLNQQRAIRNLFAQKHDQANLVLVRGDSLHTNGYNSIRESITNLISAEFFMSKGYMVLEDTGSGPDVIAFKSSLLHELRERRFIGKGGSMCELAAVRAFGKVNQSYRDDILKDEVIAVESESVSPRKGINQLRSGYGGARFAYLGFFDRRVLAAPFLNQGATSFDILTYDLNGLEYRKSANVVQSRDFWRSKKLAFLEELHNSMRAMLLLNLTYEEIAGMVSGRPARAARVLYEASKITTEKVLDKIESVI